MVYGRFSVQGRDWLWRGWQIRYQFTSGPGEVPVLFLHGFGASGRHWRHNLGALGSRYRAYTLDLLGFGASEKVATYYSLELWVEQVHDFYQGLVGQPLVVVGNSLGALVGLLFAYRYPQAVRGVVTVSLPDVAEMERSIPAPVRPVKQFLEGTIGGVLATPLFYIFRQPWIIRWVLSGFVYGHKQQNIDRELVEIIASPARERQAVIAFNWLNRGMSRSQSIPSAKQIIPALKVPLLIVWGSNDRVIPPKPAKKLASYSPLAEVAILKGLGHCPQDEDPQQFNQLLLDWLDRAVVG